MVTIPKNTPNEQAANRSIKAFFKSTGVNRILKKSNAYKSKGVPPIEVFLYLVQLVFTKKSMYMDIQNGSAHTPFARDVVYRFLNATYINWARFLLSLSSLVVQRIVKLTSESRRNALIIDDSVYERQRSKKVELLANVHDHAEKSKSKYKRGFRMLTLAWSDGVTLIPLMFRHLSSSEKKNRFTEMNATIDKRSVGYKIRQQAISNTTDVLIDMLDQAKKVGIPAQHVVFDSWFSFPSTMMRISQLGFDTVGRLKNTTKIKYWADGEKKTLKQIYAANKKRRGRSKYLLSVEVLLYNDNEETLPARIVFVRDRNRRDKWIAFASTDMSLTEEEIVALYGKRWDIEVFFKTCKSYLNLGREFQGLSYDSITAHTTVVMTRYIILASYKRQEDDPRALGELFFSMYDEVADVRFSDALSVILSMLHNVLDECLFLSQEQVSLLVQRFVDRVAKYFDDCFMKKKSKALDNSYCEV
jgi:hypothetical protein